MTVVVSEIGRFGIAMVGDSAVTIRAGAGGMPTVYDKAAKVQYSPAANMGFAMWGTACVGGITMDACWRTSSISGSKLMTQCQRLPTDWPVR